jgi:hypothetical protein
MGCLSTQSEKEESVRQKLSWGVPSGVCETYMCLAKACQFAMGLVMAHCKSFQAEPQIPFGTPGSYSPK